MIFIANSSLNMIVAGLLYQPQTLHLIHLHTHLPYMVHFWHNTGSTYLFQVDLDLEVFSIITLFYIINNIVNVIILQQFNIVFY